jgi:PEP-CTERM motif
MKQLALHRIAAAAVLVACGSAHALVTVWDGASGLLPSAVDPGWTLTDDAPTNPSFASGVLTIQTSLSQNYRQFYSMAGVSFDAPPAGPYWLEAEMRFVSGTQLGGWWRSPAVMGFRFDNGRLAILEIRKDFIYIRNGDNTVGASNANVDTDDAFHTYRLEALGTASGSVINVFQDGVLVLTDNALYNAGGDESVFFGESSTLALGVSEWKRVSHNMAAVATPVPEPGTYALLCAGVLLVASRLRRQGEQGLR